MRAVVLILARVITPAKVKVRGLVMATAIVQATIKGIDGKHFHIDHFETLLH